MARGRDECRTTNDERRGGSRAPPRDDKATRLCRHFLTSSDGTLDPPGSSTPKAFASRRSNPDVCFQNHPSDPCHPRLTRLWSPRRPPVWRASFWLTSRRRVLHAAWQMQRKKSPLPLASDLSFRQAKLPFIPMKPSRSRCNMISWAASSGERSAVLMVTSASVGIS